MNPMLSHMLRRAYRSLGENLYLNAVAAGVIAAALMLIGTYLLVMANVQDLVKTWDRDVHISAYFYSDVPVDRRFAVKDDLARFPEVEQLRYISESDARQYMEEAMPEIATVLSDLGDTILPASLEITLKPSFTRPGDVARFAQKIQIPEFEDIDFSQEWVQRFNSFLSMLQLLGIVMGMLILLAAVFLVGNTMHLVTYSRRDELVTMKLVGATWGFISIPFVLEGVAQGLLGALLAITGLYSLHYFLVLRLQEYLQLTLTGDVLIFLPVSWILLLSLCGILLGITGGLFSLRRFWQAAP